MPHDGHHEHDEHNEHHHQGAQHKHPHGDGHAHEHHHHEVTREDLPRGIGAGKILYFDAPSGIAGDMTISALVDLGVPESIVVDAVSALGLTGFHLHFSHKHVNQIVATKFDVHEEVTQPQRNYAQIRTLIEASSLSPSIKSRALKTFQRLAVAEAQMHRTAIDDVHFHEVGALDAIADVVGSAAAIDYLAPDEILVSPLPMGRGWVKASHGVLPLPAPATVACLAGLETIDGGLEFEFVTPTGAAIVGAHAKSVRWPSFAPSHTGFGAGNATLPDRPNLLRAILGDKSANETGEHVVLETNLDDATGELVAHGIERLLTEGALDAWATPITMKKGRPAVTLSALVHSRDRDRLGTLLVAETTSLGFRSYAVTRMTRPRETVSVETPWGPVPVKVARGAFGPAQIKPEFDACVAIAKAAQIPVREVMRAALLEAAKKLA